MPTPEVAQIDQSNAINQIVLRLRDHLPAFGVEIISQPQGADLIVGHAGQTDNKTRVDLAHCHGIYPTSLMGQLDTPMWHWAANLAVIENLIHARAITVPSQWVADILRRDMHLDPHVVGWAIDPADR